MLKKVKQFIKKDIEQGSAMLEAMRIRKERGAFCSTGMTHPPMRSTL